MCLTYSANVTWCPGGVPVLWFPDLPGAEFAGDDRSAIATLAQDALLTALEARIWAWQPLPDPCENQPDQIPIPLPPLAAAKVGLYRTLHDAGWSRDGLALFLGMDTVTVSALLDLRHDIPIQDIDDVLARLGKKLMISIDDRP